MSHINSVPTSVFFTSSAEGSGSTWSIPVLSSPCAAVSQPQPSSDATTSPRLNPIPNVLISVTTIVVGMTAISGAAYVAGGFVITQLEAQANLQSPRGLEPNQPKIDPRERVFATVDSTSQASNSLADAPAKMQLDRAGRLAAIGKLKEAIASATQIQPNSPLYETAQRSIEQWSHQLLQLAEQLYTERQLSTAVAYASAIPATSTAFPDAQQLLQQWREQQQAEQSNNQQHLQMAQQALQQEDGQTAMQEAAQITDDARWQAQKAAILQKAEPFAHWQQARQSIEQNEPENAIDEAKRLPIASPWLERRNRLVETANQMIADREAEQKRREICQGFTSGFLSRCPDLTDLLGSLGNIHPGRLPAKLRKP